jgi:uncharacterized coiled-coil protein SlyX
MEIFGTVLGVGESITLLIFLGALITAWFNLKGDAKTALEEAKELTKRVDHLETKLGEQERQVSVITAQLTNIQHQISYISVRLDTLLNYLLDKKAVEDGK